MNISLSRIAGPNLELRIVEPNDAAYIYNLRCDPTYSEHLSKVQGTIADQYAWIKTYKVREETGSELYYIIARKDGKRCGTVRLYDIKKDSFTWGSWILDQNKPHKAALESALLSFDVGFQLLEASFARINVQCSNDRAIAFYRRFRMTETERTLQEMSFTYTRERFLADRDEYLAILKKAVQ